MTRWLTVDDFEDLGAGSQLGVFSAANTFPGSMALWVRELMQERGRLPLVGVEEAHTVFDEGAHAVAVGGVGSLPATLEIPFRGDEPRVVIERMERIYGRPFVAIAALNSAGPNALLAVAAACLLGLPLLDCDGQGRVLPLLDQTTYALGGLSPGPMVGVGPWGDLVTIESPRGRFETLTRAAVTAAGGWLFCALYPAPVRDLTRSGIANAISRCVEIGATLRGGTSGPRGRLARRLGGRLIGRGRVLQIEQHSDGGGRTRQPAQPIGILIEDSGPTKSWIRLEVRNEVVLATIDGRIIASTPDTICMLDPLRRRTVDLIDLQLGDVVDVLFLPAAPAWHTPEGRTLAGPEAFGLPIGSLKPIM
ncbi:DUF917 domain-containing protein [Kitasatospora indigofera]|uniref:DUF917 domain-containing protein n=1 Tax=Kitasatospora indigofera TaxID=67307 RepID=UPI0033B3A283